ncbi:MAG: HlyC/CorC family transporter [Acidobacteriota bacterium]
MSDPVPALVGLVLLLALSGFFSGSETALMAVNRYRLSYLARRGDKSAARVRSLVAMPDRLISTILLGNNFANTAASAVATAWAISVVGDRGTLYATLIMTALILILSEITPKTLAARNPERVSFLVSVPIATLVKVLYPLASIATAVANALLFRWGKPHPQVAKVSAEDIEGIISLGEEERVIAREKRQMLHGILRLTETTIEDVMIPRTQVVAISVNAQASEILDVIRRSGNTRFPVYEGTLDDIVGVLHSKDVFRYWERLEEMSLRSLARKPLFVPESAALEDLLQAFQLQRKHLAIVIDEYGGVEGIVSLEDLLEEIVGEIEDEYDLPRTPQVMELPDGSLLVGGACPLSFLNRQYGLELKAQESTTLAGLLLEITGRIPKPGERILHAGLTFLIQRARPHRVEQIRVEGIVAPGSAAEEKR